MNKTYLCVLPLALFLAGSPGYSGTEVPECPNKGPADTQKCDEVGAPRSKIVNVDLETLEADPYCVRVHLGTTIVFTWKGALERSKVKILPKDDFDSWLQGKNDPNNNAIFVTIPGTYKTDEQKAGPRKRTVHYYSIYLPNGECLDPRVEVEH